MKCINHLNDRQRSRSRSSRPVSFGRLLCCSLLIFLSGYGAFFSFARFLIFHLNDLLANAEQLEVIFILFVVSPCFWPFLISLTLSVCAKENKALFLSHLQIKFIGKSYNNLLKNNGLWQKSFLISKALAGAQRTNLFFSTLTVCSLMWLFKLISNGHKNHFFHIIKSTTNNTKITHHRRGCRRRWPPNQRKKMYL